MNNTNYFGFKDLVEFFRRYEGEKYVDPQKAGRKSNYMLNIQKIGKQVRSNFKRFGKTVESNFHDLILADCKNWQGNKGKGCPMEIKSDLWIELKNPKWKDKPQSISFSIGANDILCIRVEIDDKNVKGDTEIYKHQFHLLDLPLENSGFVYRVIRKDKTYDYKNADKVAEMINESPVPKLQVVKIITNVSYKDEHGTLLKETVTAIEKLNSFYKHLMESSKNKFSRKYWLYSPGEQASNWDEFYGSGIMGLGWDHVGNLRKYNSKDDIEKALKESEDTKSDQLINAKALWQFANDMKPGDIVFAKKGKKLIIGKGVVTSDYFFDEERSELKHVRSVNWTNKGVWKNPSSEIIKALTLIDNIQEAEKLNALFKDDLQFKNDFSWMLHESKNLILRGAPGTGKSYLAKEIAADIVTNGQLIDGKPIKFADLSDEQKKQVAFVQFHPNYDYSDFVEGLRPKINDDGTMGFELKDGIFKSFVAQARKNYEDSLKTLEDIEKETSVQELMMEFFSSIDFGKDLFKTISGTEFKINSIDDEHISIEIPENQTANKISLRVDEVRKMLESDVNFAMIKDVTSFFGKTFATQAYSYDFAIYKAIKAKKAKVPKTPAKQTELKKFVFIIDEINRGEISKIFGELFYSIDPGYRGRDGEIFTQYSNMHSDPNEKFYIPDNVYIIGTMNDIDRSVDSFDFAMRRRFRFVELKASEQLKMLDSLNDDLKEDAKHRMEELNKAIIKEKELNENYQIGAAYFLKLNYLDFDKLWTDYLEPLLHEYVRGMYDELDIMKRLADAYGYKNSTEGDADESDQN